METNIILQKINQFRDERNWRQFHNAKDLAISVSLEANELLELFQWKTSEEAIEKYSEELQDELADVFIYASMMADTLGFDIPTIIENKLYKNSIKYPVEKAKNRKEKYNELS